MGGDGSRRWRDLDRARDRGGRSTREGAGKQGRPSASYGAYKAQLEKMWSPGGPGLPEALRAQLGPQSEEAAARSQAVAAFREEPNDANLEALDASGAELPEDARLLMASLDSLVQEDNIRRVLGHLLALVEAGRRPHRMLLLQKLTALEHRMEEADTRLLVSDLRGALE